MYPKTRIEGKVLVLGHRGAPFKEIENTIESFQTALKDGADGVELDVRVTTDHRLVVSHDNSLKRVYGSDIRIEESSLAEIHEVAPQIPLLSQVFDALGPVWYDIEIKADQPLGYNKEVVTLLVEELEKHPELEQKLLVSSFNPFALRQFGKETKNRYPMGLIYEDTPTFPRMNRKGQLRIFFRCSFLKPKWDIVVREKQSKGKYPTYPWTIDREEELTEAHTAGAPIVITNDTEKIIGILQKQGLR